MADDDQRKKVARRASLAALLLFLLPKRTGHDTLRPDDFVRFNNTGDALAWAKRHKFAAVVAHDVAGAEFVRRLHTNGYVVPAVVVGANIEAMRHATEGLRDVHYLHDNASEDEVMHAVHQSVAAREALAKLRGEPAASTLAGGTSASGTARTMAIVAALALLLALGFGIPHLLGGSGGAPPHRGGSGGAPQPQPTAPSSDATPTSANAVPSGTFPTSNASGVPTMTTPSPSSGSPGPTSAPQGSAPPLPPDASLVVNDGDGKPVVSQNGGVSRAPASTLKLVVAAAANKILGPDFRFTTTVGSGSAPRDGALPNVIIQGDGDPTLTSADLASAAQQLYARGVRRIGDVNVVTAPFEGAEQNPQWSAEDKHAPYGAGSSAVSLDGNLKDNVPVTGIPQFVGDALKAQLSAAGIAVNGNVTPVAKAPLAWTAWVHHSPALPEITRQMLFESKNLYAEQLLRRIGVAKSGVGSADAGTQAEMTFLQETGVPTDGINLVDGSGLAESNRITASTLATMLSRLPPDAANALYNELPVLGEQGTLATRLREAHARAKDGRLRDVDALAGYVDTAKHGRAAFAFIINRENLSRSQTHDFGDSVAAALARY